MQNTTATQVQQQYANCNYTATARANLQNTAQHVQQLFYNIVATLNSNANCTNELYDTEECMPLDEFYSCSNVVTTASNATAEELNVYVQNNTVYVNVHFNVAVQNSCAASATVLQQLSTLLNANVTLHSVSSIAASYVVTAH